MPRKAITILIAALAASSLHAAGGGGGGGAGGSMPSSSAPAYDPAVEYRNGLAALQSKDFKAAKRHFDKVIAVAPGDANVQYLAGLSRSGLEDWKGSRRYYEKAVKLNGDLIGAHQELGVAHAKAGDRAKADAILTGLRAKAKECAAACSRAAELKAAIDAVSAALAGMPTAARGTPDGLFLASAAQGDLRYLTAVALINERKYEEALVTLAEARTTFGPHPDILTYQGFASRKLGRFDTAEGYYKAALAVAPTHRGATEYFGELKVERGDLAGARRMLAKLDAQCRFGCAEAEDLRRWIALGRSPNS